MSPLATPRPVASDLERAERELLERADALVAEARRAGAEEAEAIGVRLNKIAVRFEKGDLKLTQVDDRTSLGLRVFRERRLGFASTNQADPASLARIAADALALSRFAPPDPHNALSEPRPVPPLEALVDPQLAALRVEEAVAFGSDLLARVRAVDPRLSIDGAGFEVSVVQRALSNSRGARSVESDALAGVSVMGMAIDGDDVGGMHYDGDALRRREEIAPAIERLAATFGRLAVENLGAGAAESYRGPVLFSPDAFLDAFVEPLVAAASAIAVQRGRSLLAGKLGTRVASERLSIRDDPRDRGLAGAAAFDREGQPALPLDLVERGHLASYLYNGYAAAVEGRASTGHAQGGARSVPGLGPHALAVAPGDGGTRAELCAALGRGLHVQRFSGTVDPASGDFSGVAKSARWIEGGASVRSVRETLVSGNAYALLLEILALGSVVERCGGAARAPAALVDGVSVTAG